MEKIQLSLSLLREISDELKKKVANNHFSHVTVINSSDILFNFSFYTKEKMLISLNHHHPFISLIDKNFNSPTLNGGLSENLRKLIKGAYVTNIEVINDDRILKFSLLKTDDFYQKEEMSMYVELIPTRTNLIILNNKEEILFAYHYLDLTHNRPVIKGLKYELPQKANSLSDIEVDAKEYKRRVNSYLVEAESKRKKEEQKPLYDHLVHKRKSLYRKIDVLNKEIEKAKAGLIYKEYGEMIFALINDEENLEDYINTNLQGVYDDLLSPSENANKIFAKYKKNKRTIEMDSLEIEKAEAEIEVLDTSINAFDYLDNDEINELYIKYLPKKSRGKKVKVDAKFPFYVTLGNTVIGFGKNATQNNYLTFKKANKDHLFLHINESKGAHVVIFSNNPTNEEMLTASEICLILSGENVGDIKYCKISEIKKGTEPGKVLINSYKLITLREIRNETYALLRNQKRFSN